MAARIERLAARLGREFSADGMLVLSAANIRYLTGFAGSSSGLLVLSERAILMTDARYTTWAARATLAPHLGENQVEVVSQAKLAELVQDALPTPARLVIEDETMSMAQFTRLKEELPGVELVPAGDIVLEQRLVKDPSELARIRAAAAITDAAVEDLLVAEPVGWSELEIASYLLERLVALGAERAAFEPVVAVGERSASPHSRPSHERLHENEILLIDVGAEVDGYKADLTRTVWWGELSPELEQTATAVSRAYDAAVAMIGPGVRYAAVDDAVRAVLRDYDIERLLVHPVGHNLGLEIHERPFLGQSYEGALESGNVVTIEPAAYVPNRGGIRMEDTFLITDTGPVALTRATSSGRRVRSGAARGVSTRNAAVSVQDGPRVHWDEEDLTEERIDFEKLDDHKRFLIGDRAPWQPFDEEQAG